MPELYQDEPFVHNQIPIRIFNHVYDGEAIFTVTHWHRNIEFNLVTDGRIVRIVDGHSTEQTAGGLSIVNSGVLHADHWADPGDHFEGITVQISKYFMDSWMGEQARFAVPEDPKAQESMRELMRRFGEIRRKKDETEEGLQTDLLKYRTMVLLFEFLSLLRVSFMDSGTQENVRAVKAVSGLKEVVNYIDLHYAEDLTLTQVAEEFHYTSAYLSRVFKEHIGISFHDYLQHVRLMHCVEEMKKDPELQLTACAMDHGFPNVKSFISTFRRYFGVTPSAWLKSRSWEK